MRVTRGEITGGPGKMQPARGGAWLSFLLTLCVNLHFLPFVRSAENKAKTEQNIEFTRISILTNYPNLARNLVTK